ncbi:MAG: RNA-binding protein [Candidatus Omnitrophica bacterium]|nr:RNA-binding protein [Candidatus Omnitrophota bacterium]MCK5287457.1 RNA-binding protein [Candidatus Omnitrophota bacterium]MCK5494625.1 RNA-binding protein [Candidatus Omnitrophota bacterium]
MEDEKKVYLGNLEFGLTEEDLQKSFDEKHIAVKEIKIITDKFSGRSKGFGFAEFDTPELAQQAIDVLNDSEINGRKLRVSKAKKMAPRNDFR